MAVYTPVTTETLRSRQSYRTDLAVLLRDTGNTIWTTTVLNACLDEALGLVQAHYPPVRVFEYTPSATNLQQLLPADCEKVLEVLKADEGSGKQGTALLFAPVAFDVIRLPYPIATSGTEDLSTLILVLRDEPDVSLEHYVRYRAAQQVWGSWATIGSGVDTATTKDLNPATIGDGLPLLLLWAAAKVAALEYAAQMIPSDGGRDWLAELEVATRKRDGLLARAQRPRQGLIGSSVFG